MIYLLTFPIQTEKASSYISELIPIKIIDASRFWTTEGVTINTILFHSLAV